MGQNGVPAYRQIQDAIAKRIDSGRLKPGERIQSERELARIHGVSLMTVRHALGRLELEGLIHRRHGTGTFVAPPKVHFNRLMSFTEQLASRALTGGSKLISSATIEDPAIAARLGLPPRHPMIRLERLRLGGAEPLALETAHLSAEQFPNLIKRSLEKDSLFSVLDRENGVSLAHADEEIDATVADSRTAELLAVREGAPLLRMRQLIFSKLDKPIIHMLGLYRSDRHTLTIRRFR